MEKLQATLNLTLRHKYNQQPLPRHIRVHFSFPQKPGRRGLSYCCLCCFLNPSLYAYFQLDSFPKAKAKLLVSVLTYEKKGQSVARLKADNKERFNQSSMTPLVGRSVSRCFNNK
ncbi:CLUMA_CG019830, isoform A [Clunio marinus]|uniref:CLUMA_CG019830, isoform A n=1 Tax=Clunio marinus TaxID=568069 RepID=A0A1J1J1R5_9DIPT|nr:CLUMA_CG019830, isoform A [Clunio marinus]